MPASALVVVAHADDAEFAAGGTIALWADAGCRIDYVVCTRGDRGSADRSSTPAAIADLRRAEQRAAADVLGVGSIVQLGYPDGALTADLDVIRELVGVIRRVQPHVLVTHDPYRPFHDFVSHRDHRMTGLAALDAAFPYAGMADCWPGHGAPHRVGATWRFGAGDPDVRVDIAAVAARKWQSVRCHASQVPDDATMAVMTSRLAARFQPAEDWQEAEWFRVETWDWELETAFAG